MAYVKTTAAITGLPAYSVIDAQGNLVFLDGGPEPATAQSLTPFAPVVSFGHGLNENAVILTRQNIIDLLPVLQNFANTGVFS